MFYDAWVTGQRLTQLTHVLNYPTQTITNCFRTTNGDGLHDLESADSILYFTSTALRYLELVLLYTCQAALPAPRKPLKQARLLPGLLQLVKLVEHGAAARPSKLRLEECDALRAGLSLH